MSLGCGRMSNNQAAGSLKEGGCRSANSKIGSGLFLASGQAAAAASGRPTKIVPNARIVFLSLSTAAQSTGTRT